uniref:Uncharacterized protein n=1 Tax=Arundo donax TaxID=35708 RepID=A0A0A8YSR8_ARUDO
MAPRWTTGRLRTGAACTDEISSDC